MAHLPHLSATPLEVRVFGQHADTSKRTEAGTFIAYLPNVPAIGSIVNVADVDAVEWVGDDAEKDFEQRVRDAGVLFAVGLKILSIGYQLDGTAKCVGIRADADLCNDDTIG